MVRTVRLPCYRRRICGPPSLPEERTRPGPRLPAGTPQAIRREAPNVRTLSLGALVHSPVAANARAPASSRGLASVRSLLRASWRGGTGEQGDQARAAIQVPQLDPRTLF